MSKSIKCPAWILASMVVVMIAVTIYASRMEFEILDHYVTIGMNPFPYVFHFWSCYALLTMGLLMMLFRVQVKWIKDIGKWISLFAIIFTVCTLLIKITYYTQQVKEVCSSGYVYELTLTDLEHIAESNDTYTLYVSRQDCIYCQEAYAFVTKYAAQQHIEVLFYNTSRDRETDRERLDKMLQKFQIDSVPMLLEIEKGQVKERLDSASLLAEKYSNLKA